MILQLLSWGLVILLLLYIFGMTRKSKMPKETIEYIDSFRLQKRWHRCQNIAKVFYDSDLTDEVIEDLTKQLKKFPLMVHQFYKLFFPK